VKKERINLNRRISTTKYKYIFVWNQFYYNITAI